ncbi:hypothetical protein QFC20_006017 [Naganishia adeliensis]|uniref:Uncharacterized protein n=1 Tax=Naganishia adeliensis TaxID=92952 RepID=A0ACC2VH92_9TREE|nr:hypothetical protein QFC20_006017 [Naganishia adeliensis]
MPIPPPISATDCTHAISDMVSYLALQPYVKSFSPTTQKQLHALVEKEPPQGPAGLEEEPKVQQKLKKLYGIRSELMGASFGSSGSFLEMAPGSQRAPYQDSANESQSSNAWDKAEKYEGEDEVNNSQLAETWFRLPEMNLTSDNESIPESLDDRDLAGESFLTATELDPSSTRTVTNGPRPKGKPQAYSDELNSICSSAMSDNQLPGEKPQGEA